MVGDGEDEGFGGLPGAEVFFGDREAQKVVSVVFDGAILSSTGLAIVDGAYRGLPCPASPCPIPLCNLPRGRELKMAFATILGMW